MRVFLMTSHLVSPPWNSGDKHLARELLLRDSGVDHIFMTDREDVTEWPPRSQPIRVAMHTDTPTATAKLRMYLALLRRAPRVDAVHSIVAYRRGELAQVAVGMTSMVRRSRLVVTCPTGWSLPRRLLRRADAAVAISDATASRLRELGCRGVARIRPGVDLDALQPQPPEPARAALGLPDVPTVLFAGHYLPGGGLDACLQVVAALRRRSEVHLVLAMRSTPRSAGGSADGPRRLRATLADLGLTGCVSVLGSTPDMRMAIAAASVVLFQPSELNLKTELPITLLEALASGRPVVVSGTTPLPELADGTAAVSVLEPDDVDTTAARIASLIADGNGASLAARALAEARYDARAMVAGYAEVYAGLDRS